MSLENISTAISALPKGNRKYFSVSEANRALPYVSRIVDEIIDTYKQAVGIRQQIEDDDFVGDGDQLHKDYERVMDRLNVLLDEIHHVGVEMKDFEKGLLDFPAIYDGREIYLCWRRGEQSVHAWHELEDGYAGRQNVSLLEDN